MELCPFNPCEELSVVADIDRKGDALQFSYLIEGQTSGIVIPPTSQAKRTDQLWNSTCFEAFISTGETSYIEMNFAPSGRWAAYSFTNYREGMGELDIAPPLISFAGNRLTATVGLAAEPGSAVNLTAVIVFESGLRSYWALAHPNANRPDFHARDCFVAKLP